MGSHPIRGFTLSSFISGILAIIALPMHQDSAKAHLHKALATLLKSAQTHKMPCQKHGKFKQNFAT